jgi:hypothetical protein
MWRNVDRHDSLLYPLDGPMLVSCVTENIV